MEMSSFIENLITEGYCNIVSESCESHEEESGFQTEYTERLFVAERGQGEYVRISVTEKKEFGPRGKISCDKSAQPISEDEYNRIAGTKPRLDTEEVRTRMAEVRRRDDEQQALKKQLRDSAPRCSDHNVKMRLKVGMYGKFWGCPKYPACRKTAQLSPEQQHLLSLSK
jgi:hypothetical protein